MEFGLLCPDASVVEVAAPIQACLRHGAGLGVVGEAPGLALAGPVDGRRIDRDAQWTGLAGSDRHHAAAVERDLLHVAGRGLGPVDARQNRWPFRSRCSAPRPARIKQRPPTQVPEQSASQADPSAVPASTTTLAPHPDAPSIASGGGWRLPNPPTPPEPGAVFPGLVRVDPFDARRIDTGACVAACRRIGVSHCSRPDTDSSVPIATRRRRGDCVFPRPDPATHRSRGHGRAPFCSPALLVAPRERAGCPTIRRMDPSLLQALPRDGPLQSMDEREALRPRRRALGRRAQAPDGRNFFEIAPQDVQSPARGRPHPGSHASGRAPCRPSRASPTTSSPTSLICAANAGQ